MELLAGQHKEAATPFRNSNNFITSAKLLENVESVKEIGKILFDYSNVVYENREPLVITHVTDSEFYTFDKIDLEKLQIIMYLMKNGQR